MSKRGRARPVAQPGLKRARTASPAASSVTRAARGTPPPAVGPPQARGEPAASGPAAMAGDGTGAGAQQQRTARALRAQARAPAAALPRTPSTVALALPPACARHAPTARAASAAPPQTRAGSGSSVVQVGAARLGAAGVAPTMSRLSAPGAELERLRLCDRPRRLHRQAAPAALALRPPAREQPQWSAPGVARACELGGSVSDAVSSLLALSNPSLAAELASVGARAAGWRGPRARAPRGCGCPLLALLGEDELGLLAASVHVDDVLALALTCRTLRAATGARDALGGGGVLADAKPFRVTTSVLSLATSIGRLQWGLSCGAQLNASLCAAAAARGALAALIRLRAVGCPWDHKTCVRAAEGGHFEVLKWAHVHGCPVGLVKMVICCAAARNGDLEMLSWLFANGFKTVSYFVSSDAASHGRLAVLQWLHAHGWCEWKMCTLYAAACHGHLDVLRWMVANGFPWNAEISARARDCIERHCTVNRAALREWLDAHGDGGVQGHGAGAGALGPGLLGGPAGFF